MNDLMYKVIDNDKLRQRVLTVIYSVKTKYKLPFIEVVIIPKGKEHPMKLGVVHAREHWLTMGRNTFTHQILHELVHAVTGFEHDQKCYLMRDYEMPKPNWNMSWKSFDKYLNHLRIDKSLRSTD